MSLKSFHLLFIVIATILCFGLATWAIDAHTSRGEQGAILLAVVSLVAGVSLVIYGVRIRVKFKSMGGL
jgi:ABC-type amino acid transport system permease subunit